MPRGSKTIPVVDLFAGPGGLGEGFAAFKDSTNQQVFQTALSIEKERWAHQTLLHRSAFRNLKRLQDKLGFLELISDNKPESARKLQIKFQNELQASRETAWRAELGVDNRTEVDPECDHPDRYQVIERISQRLGSKSKPWVLLGGPPCQAYSLVGRSRNIGKSGYRAENDHRHFLYREYLAIIAELWPTVFVMENVKGILSAKIHGKLIFNQILQDLRDPATAINRGSAGSHRYRIVSLTLPEREQNADMLPSDYVVRCESYGIPQARHRVILLGVREDISLDDFKPLRAAPMATVDDAIGDLPMMRSTLSNRVIKSQELASWHSAIAEFPLSTIESEGYFDGKQKLLKELRSNLRRIRTKNTNVDMDSGRASRTADRQGYLNLHAWYRSGFPEAECLKVLNHEPRSHMREDLWRYFFSSTFASEYQYTPPLGELPGALIPKHKNLVTFLDRFRVQVETRPSTTVTSHISKDGHYYIHYDPFQCRSLTVREAARLQTFPDSYYFCGPRTAQYQQVGNAVPPLLAYQIAKIVFGLIHELANHG